MLYSLLMRTAYKNLKMNLGNDAECRLGNFDLHYDVIDC